MKRNWIFIFILTVFISIIIILFNFKKEKMNILINEIEFSGLCNRLFGISGSFILSQISNRNFFCIIYIYY